MNVEKRGRKIVRGADWLTKDFPVYFVGESLAFGSQPENDVHVKALENRGFKVVVNLANDPRANWKERESVGLTEMSYHEFSIADGPPIDPFLLHALLHRLRRELADGHPVYLHCAVGVSRSPFVVAAYGLMPYVMIALVKKELTEALASQYESVVANVRSDIFPAPPPPFVDSLKEMVYLIFAEVLPEIG